MEATAFYKELCERQKNGYDTAAATVIDGEQAGEKFFLSEENQDKAVSYTHLDMPAAVLQQGTTANQKRIVATVATLADEVEKKGIETPAIIVVGKVCALAKEFEWYERLPLFGKKIVVTRPKDLVSRMTKELRKKGAEVLELPAIRTAALEDQSKLIEKVKEIGTYQWLSLIHI